MSSKQRIVLLAVAVFLLLTAVFAVACNEEQNDENVATIYFVTDTDEQIAPVKRTIGGRMGELPTLQRENYKFEGWYTDKNTSFYPTNRIPKEISFTDKNGKNAVKEYSVVTAKTTTPQRRCDQGRAAFFALREGCLIAKQYTKFFII